eukprot:TRINITY_DN4558_c0_g1_i1.p1 TRINITY_DN4558_c0_g1~~TRINITY_DN4558_c0_g1_i1.p1  ORF type:complete len:640 (-),score=190.16 TRINITY_DN4558_c0_g1_i1:55-1974(-)
MASVSVFRLLIFCSLAWVACVCASAKHATSSTAFYVSPSGSDANNGLSPSTPFQSLARAQTAVRAVNSKMTSDIFVYLLDGYHELKAPLVFSPSDSGSNGHNVVWAAYQEQEPVITGSISVPGPWKLFNSTLNMYVADLPAAAPHPSRLMWVNGRRANRTRWILDEWQGGLSSGFVTCDPFPATWLNSKTGQSLVEAFYLFDEAAWEDFVFPVMNIVPYHSPTCTGPGNNGSAIHFFPNTTDSLSVWAPRAQPTGLYNVFELMGTPGEYYIDSFAGKVYYIPVAGLDDMTQLDARIPILEQLVIFNSTGLDPIYNVQFQSVSFQHTTWKFPSNPFGYINVQGGFFLNEFPPPVPYYDSNYGVPPCAVEVHGGYFSAFERCTFAHLGAAGLCFWDGSQNGRVEGSLFTDISSVSLMLGQLNDWFVNITANTTRELTVVNNVFHNVPSEFPGSVVIYGGFVMNCVVEHNEIFNSSYTGISWAWAAGGHTEHAGNNSISYNYIHDDMSIMNDGGGIYTLGYQIPPTVVNNNYLTRQIDTHWGMLYFDNGSANFTASNNVVDNSQGMAWVLFNGPTVVDIHVNNTFVASPAADDGRGTDCTVSNTFVVGNNWPPEAKAIMAAAGVMPEHKDRLQKQLAKVRGY